MVGSFGPLLISATDISFFELGALLEDYHGFMVPAHVDKKSNSLFSQLGFVPEGCGFSCFEVHEISNGARLQEKFPLLKDCSVLCSSDAHRLDGLHEREYFLGDDLMGFFRNDMK